MQKISILLEYTQNYSLTSGRLWNYYRDEIIDDENENDNDNNRINNGITITRKSCEYKTKLMRRKPNDNNTLNVDVVAPLKYLSNCWRFLDQLLINCEVKLDLSCSKECIIPEISITPRVTVLDVAALQITGAIFQINNAKCSVPVVNLSFNDDIKFLENLKKGFKRTIS